MPKMIALYTFVGCCTAKLTAATMVSSWPPRAIVSASSVNVCSMLLTWGQSTFACAQASRSCSSRFFTPLNAALGSSGSSALARNRAPSKSIAPARSSSPRLNASWRRTILDSCCASFCHTAQIVPTYSACFALSRIAWAISCGSLDSKALMRVGPKLKPCVCRICRACKRASGLADSCASICSALSVAASSALSTKRRCAVWRDHPSLRSSAATSSSCVQFPKALGRAVTSWRSLFGAPELSTKGCCSSGTMRQILPRPCGPPKSRSSICWRRYEVRNTRCCKMPR